MARAGTNARGGCWMRSLFVVCASLFVVSTSASVWLWRELRAERELAAALRAPDADFIQAAPAPVPVEAAAVVAPPPAVSEAASAAPAQALEVNATPAAQTSWRQRENSLLHSQLWKDPEYLKAQLEQARASILRRSPNLARELDLSPDELGKLLDALAEQQVSLVSAAAVEPATARMQEMLRAEQEDIGQPDPAIVAALGPAKAAQWQEYQQMEPARNRVNSVNAVLARSGQQLDDTQRRSLTVALAPEVQRVRRETSKLAARLDPRDPDSTMQVESAVARLQQESNRRFLEAAEPLLNPAQFAAMRAQLEEEDAIARAEARANERAAALQSRGQ